jgi:hypothetical protein
VQEANSSGIFPEGFKNGQLFWPMRVALTGEQFSPGVFEVLWALDKEESLKRIKKVTETLKLKYISSTIHTPSLYNGKKPRHDGHVTTEYYFLAPPL